MLELFIHLNNRKACNLKDLGKSKKHPNQKSSVLRLHSNENEMKFEGESNVKFRIKIKRG